MQPAIDQGWNWVGTVARALQQLGVDRNLLRETTLAESSRRSTPQPMMTRDDWLLDRYLSRTRSMSAIRRHGTTSLT